MTVHGELPDSAPKPGETFAGKYRIERVLGVGGMGYVLAAKHIQLDERVAIKMLLPELSRSAETVERFLREGRAAIKIKSEHVTRVLDVAEDNGTPYMIMEYLDGLDLADLLAKEGALRPSRAIAYILQACEAIAEAHAHRMVHRDIKPSNLFLSKRADGSECVKVLDFGISKMTQQPGGLAMTKTSSMLGSPLYMSPEQLRNSKNVDERADIWAIGVTLFQLIADEHAFMAETLAELGALVLSGERPWLSDVGLGVPEEVSAIVDTCLQKDAAHRFVNLADFADAIAPFGDAGSLASRDRIVRLLGMPATRARIAGRRAASVQSGATVLHANPAPFMPASGQVAQPHALPPPRESQPSALAPSGAGSGFAMTPQPRSAPAWPEASAPAPGIRPGGVLGFAIAAIVLLGVGGSGIAAYYAKYRERTSVRDGVAAASASAPPPAISISAPPPMEAPPAPSLAPTASSASSSAPPSASIATAPARPAQPRPAAPKVPPAQPATPAVVTAPAAAPSPATSSNVAKSRTD